MLPATGRKKRRVRFVLRDTVARHKELVFIPSNEPLLDVHGQLDCGCRSPQPQTVCQSVLSEFQAKSDIKLPLCRLCAAVFVI